MRIPSSAVSVTFMTSGGPGGQHQNRRSTGVTLVFRIPESGLPEETARRLRSLAGARLNQRDEIVIQAREHRSREQNLQAARQRLERLLERAFRRARSRVPTAPTPASRERRLAQKRLRGLRKRERGSTDD